VYSQEAVPVWGTGLSGGAPDSVRWCTGQCPVRQAASAEDAALGKFADGVRLKFTGLSGVHRTVR
jgi:hypothetical protein